MTGTDDRRWLIIAANVAAAFVVLGRAQEAWASSVLGAFGPYLLWMGLAALGGLVAWTWTDEEAT